MCRLFEGFYLAEKVAKMLGRSKILQRTVQKKQMKVFSNYFADIEETVYE